jgi:hypothetical protein
MREQLETNNYLLIEDFISSDKAANLYTQFNQHLYDFPELFSTDKQCPKSQAIYNFRPFLELLIEKIPFITTLMNEPMLPTYCYSRIYKNDEVLTKHTDRGACEVSITVHLGNDGISWPIYFTKPNGEVASAELKPGQAVIYLGCISEHWRDKYEGKRYGQAFLHYVKSRGPNSKFYFDKSNTEI